uniref:Uncharacterized protein n=1 Tax=Oryza barthii TaxID=65489 RepID=A0A0D3EQB5_9ORYZ
MQDLYTIYKFDVYSMYIGIWNEEYWKQEDGGGAWGSVEEDDRQLSTHTQQLKITVKGFSDWTAKSKND